MKDNVIRKIIEIFATIKIKAKLRLLLKACQSSKNIQHTKYTTHICTG